MIIHGDCLEILKSIPEKSIDMCFTSPNPVFYLYKKKTFEPLDNRVVGSESTNYLYVTRLLNIFDEVKRVLTDNGSCFIQLGDWYDHEGSLRCIPEFFSLSMIARGWYLAAKLIWHRPINRKEFKKQTIGFIKDWEYCYHFTKSPNSYYFDNKSNRLWTKSIFSFQESRRNSNEFDSGFPEELVEIAIKTTVSKIDGTILDPMAGTGVTGVVAKKLGKSFIMIDIDKSKCHGMASRLSCQLKEDLIP